MLKEIAASISKNSCTAEITVRRFLDEIRSREPSVQAWEYIDAKAIDIACALDRMPSQGFLHGVPIGVKDIIDTVDLPTTYGSKIYSNYIPTRDASCVAAMRNSGAIILGKTVSTEFAFVAPSKTRNPHNLLHTPGGSSSGSAAAVAARMIPAAIGTQTSGSVIRPAAFCGVVGYKPSFGLIDRSGVKPLASSFDTVGVFTSNVSDAAFLVSIIAERPDLQDIEPAGGLKVGFYIGKQQHNADKCTLEVLERSARLIEKRGHTIKKLDFSLDGPDDVELHRDVMDWEVPQALSYEQRNHFDSLAPETRQSLRSMNERRNWRRYCAALQSIYGLRASMFRVFGDCDVLIAPAAPGEAPHGLNSTGNAIFNRAWSMLHLPCITVPAGCGKNGLPIGVQLIGRAGGDLTLLATGLEIENALGMAARE